MLQTLYNINDLISDNIKNFDVYIKIFMNSCESIKNILYIIFYIIIAFIIIIIYIVNIIINIIFYFNNIDYDFSSIEKNVIHENYLLISKNNDLYVFIVILLILFIIYIWFYIKYCIKYNKLKNLVDKLNKDVIELNNYQQN